MINENEYYKFGDTLVVKFSKENEKAMNEIVKLCFDNLPKIKKTDKAKSKNKSKGLLNLLDKLNDK